MRERNEEAPNRYYVTTDYGRQVGRQVGRQGYLHKAGLAESERHRSTGDRMGDTIPHSVQSLCVS